MAERVYVVWVCPRCGWQPNDPTTKWTGDCAAGHERIGLVRFPAVIVGGPVAPPRKDQD